MNLSSGFALMVACMFTLKTQGLRMSVRFPCFSGSLPGVRTPFLLKRGAKAWSRRHEKPEVIQDQHWKPPSPQMPGSETPTWGPEGAVRTHSNAVT